MQEDDVYTDPLFVGLTRSATLWGVPYKASVIEIVATGIIFIGTGDLLYLFVAVPIHAVLYLISAKDPNIFNALWIWSLTFGRSRNARFWGATSFSPLSTKKWDHFRVRGNDDWQ